MNFILMVEGHTEEKGLREFLQRWLDQELATRVGIKIVRFDGWSDLVRNAASKTHWHLSNSPERDNIIAVIALLDLYGPTFYPSDKVTASERYSWAKAHMERQVGHPKFRQHFAVHETEAWLLSEPSIFPKGVREALEDKYPAPEKVNSHNHPAKLLKELYKTRIKSAYIKTAEGKKLFRSLDLRTAYAKCPSLKALLDEMVLLARQAGLR